MKGIEQLISNIILIRFKKIMKIETHEKELLLSQDCIIELS